MANTRFIIDRIGSNITTKDVDSGSINNFNNTNGAFNYVINKMKSVPNSNHYLQFTGKSFDNCGLLIKDINNLNITGTNNTSGYPLTILNKGSDYNIMRVGTTGDTSYHQKYISIKNMIMDGLDISVRNQGLGINATQHLTLDNLEFRNCIWKGLRISASTSNQIPVDDANISNLRFINSSCIMAGIKNSNINNLNFAGIHPYIAPDTGAVFLISMLENDIGGMVENCRFSNISFDNMQIPSGYNFSGLNGFQFIRNCTFDNISCTNNRTSYNSGYGRLKHLILFNCATSCVNRPSSNEIRENILFTNLSASKCQEASYIFYGSQCNNVVFDNCDSVGSLNNISYEFSGACTNILVENSSIQEPVSISQNSMNIIFKCNTPDSVNNTICDMNCITPTFNLEAF